MIGRRKARCSAASAVGGEDGPADVAVGGHGCQFPPTRTTRGSHSHTSMIFIELQTGNSPEISRIIRRWPLWLINILLGIAN